MDPRALKLDAAIAGGAITSPIWLQPFNEWLQFIALALGIVIALLRIWAFFHRKSWRRVEMKEDV